MLRMPFWAAAVAATLCVQLAGGQMRASAATILGTLDSATGAFRPAFVQAPPPAGTLSASGTLVVSLKITIVSALAGSDQIQCSANANLALNAGLGGIVTEDASTQASRTGATTSCKITIPYSWNGFLSTDTVSIGYSIVALTTAGGDARDSFHPIATIKVPKSGSTTTFSVNATI